MYKLFLLMLLVFSGVVYAGTEHKQFFDTTGFTDKEMICYGRAMIGFDSVINARQGLTPNHVFKLLIAGDPLSDENLPILKIVLGAYKLEGSRHSYAIHVYGDCISN